MGKSLADDALTASPHGGGLQPKSFLWLPPAPDPGTVDLMFNRKRERDEFNEELNQYAPSEFDGDTYDWPSDEQGRPASYWEDSGEGYWGNSGNVHVLDEEEEAYRPAVGLVEGAKTLPTFKETTRAMGVRGLINPEWDDWDKTERLERIELEYTDAMRAIEHAYNEARIENYGDHQEFDDREDHHRARYPVYTWWDT